MLHNTFPPRSNSAPKPLTATLMQEVITMHEKFLKVYLPVAPEEVLTYGKSKFVSKCSNGKAMPSDFSHFYCHRVVLSTQKNFEVFFNIIGRLVAARWGPTAKNIASGSLVQPQQPAQNPGHSRPVPSLVWIRVRKWKIIEVNNNNNNNFIFFTSTQVHLTIQTRPSPKTFHGESYTRSIACCGFLTSSQYVLIYTTHIKKVILRLYFFILRSKINNWKTITGKKFRRGQKFRLTPAPVQTPATIIDPTVIYPCFYLRNDRMDSCYCRNGKVTPGRGPVFHKFWLRVRIQLRKKNTESFQSRIPQQDPVPPLLCCRILKVAGVTFSDSDCALVPKFLSPCPDPVPEIFQIWESDSCLDSCDNHRSNRHLPMFLL